MFDTVNSIRNQVEAFSIKSKDELEQFKNTFTSRKGAIAGLMEEIKNIAPDQRKAYGMAVNELKELALLKFKTHEEELANTAPAQQNLEDFTLPAVPHQLGTRHPLAMVRSQIIKIFERIGFNLSEGPEIEDDWHNFSALNFPENHPAREMQDTFFIQQNPDILLRTHTSTVQVRVMENQKPPIRTLSPGRVYRNEAISARAHCIFHQIEGLYVNEGVSFADLKQTLYYFVTEFFGKEVQVRFRPSFFPFTEPSAEIDISCIICKGDGCAVCKHSGWVEIGGAGMVDPAVLESSGIDPETYTGFAFGMGIERMTMLKYQIKDLRLFTENDLRFLRQFV